MRYLATLAVLALVALSNPVLAQPRPCLLNGEVFEDGDRVGPYVCLDGEWIISD